MKTTVKQLRRIIREEASSSKGGSKKRKVARVAPEFDGRIVTIGGKEYNVYELAEKKWLKAHPKETDPEAFFDADEKKRDQDPDGIVGLVEEYETALLKKHGVTHVIYPEGYGDEKPHRVEDYISGVFFGVVRTDAELARASRAAKGISEPKTKDKEAVIDSSDSRNPAGIKKDRSGATIVIDLYGDELRTGIGLTRSGEPKDYQALVDELASLGVTHIYVGRGMKIPGMGVMERRPCTELQKLLR